MARECGPPSWVPHALEIRTRRRGDAEAAESSSSSAISASPRDFLLQQNRRHLGGPHSRAMTPGGWVRSLKPPLQIRRQLVRADLVLVIGDEAAVGAHQIEHAGMVHGIGAAGKRTLDEIDVVSARDALDVLLIAGQADEILPEAREIGLQHRGLVAGG